MEETSKKPTPGSVGLKYGVIAALAGLVLTIVQILTGSNPYVSSFNVFGIIGIILSFVIIFFAHREFKNEGDGYMSYGQGLGIGSIIGLISSVVFIIFSYVYLNYVDTSLWAPIYENATAEMEAKGMSDSDIQNSMSLVRIFFWVFFVFVAFLLSFVYALLVPIFTSKKRPMVF